MGLNVLVHGSMVVIAGECGAQCACAWFHGGDGRRVWGSMCLCMVPWW